MTDEWGRLDPDPPDDPVQDYINEESERGYRDGGKLAFSIWIVVLTIAGLILLSLMGR
jgi:hypothetical protein